MVEPGRLEIPDYIKILDNIYGTVLVANRDRKIVYVNTLTCRVLKAKPEDLLGLSIDALVEDGRLINSATKKALDTGELVVKYVRGIMDTPILTVSNPILDGDGRLEAVVAFSVDEIFLEQIVQEMVKTRYDSIQLLDYLAHANNMNVPIVAESPAMKHIISYILRIRNADSTVLLTGQSGTGKEVLAKYIHNTGRRRDAIFLPVNCAAVPAELMESEFFGYQRGAFTGASRDGRAGFFELADHGTLFLDELGELPLPLQTKLLRVLETGEVTRLGAESGRRVDVRIVAATNRNLEEMCAAGLFREDLYYRINVISIDIPPLAQRREDIIPLARSFLKGLNLKYNTTKILSHSTMERLQTYDWPGNVRELRNVVERLHISSESDLLDLEGDELRQPPRRGDALSQPEEPPLPELDGKKPLRELVAQYERQVIHRAVAQCGGDVPKAAGLLGIDKSSLYRKLRSV